MPPVRFPEFLNRPRLRVSADTAESEGVAADAAVLSFAVGPVQPFIEAARTARDLWSGSMLLSELAFAGLVPVVEHARAGPESVVFPALGDLPRFRLWCGERPDADRRRSPCLPNRFVALVPGAVADELAGPCRAAAERKWAEIAENVRAELGRLWGGHAGWDDRWDGQIENYFDIRTSVFRVADATPERANTLLRSDFGSDEWGRLMALSARCGDAARSVRHFPPDTQAAEDVPGKCSLLGTFEQVGPAHMSDSNAFWHQAGGRSVDGVRLGRRDRFCAVALAKRFSGPAYFADALDLDRHELRIDDTATVAAREWLAVAGLSPEEERGRHDRWNGQWLHWNTTNDDTLDPDPCPPELLDRIRAARAAHGRPPAYYAVLMMDGDEMGKWLRGEKTPGKLQGRPLQSAISAALSHFAGERAPDVVRKHRGTLIYAGGDDVLALLPARTALECAGELRAAFQADDAMTAAAGVSAGLAVVHHKEDLRDALRAARDAERRAKSAGRDALELIVCRRSGEHKSVLCPWKFAPHVTTMTEAFAGDAAASDRWAYHLRAEQGTLAGLPDAAVEAEIRRQARRSERPPAPVESLSQWFCEYRAEMLKRERAGDALDGFLSLCLSASFLARGRDE